MAYTRKMAQLSLLLALALVPANLIPAAAQSGNNGGTTDNVPPAVQGQSGQGNHMKPRMRNRTASNGANPAGPGWVKGQDGAQNTRALKRRMKIQERRQLQQYDQQQLQVKEQQQQQYEKDMLQNLSKQRPQLKNGHRDVEEVRQETGADK